MTDLLNRATLWRDYPALLKAARLEMPAPAVLDGPPREAAMRRCIALLWGAFAEQSLSWIGFYAKVPAADEMVLVCREPKPACSPIGLHGMCGRGWQERRTIIIPDVRTLGPHYIACDPKDQSELVLPVMNADGSCWGVLDADSFDLNAFDEHDARGMAVLMERLGISAPTDSRPIRL